MVNMINEFMAALAILCLMILFIRWLFWNIIDFKLNKKTRKERKQGITFKERLFYSRYRTEIPRLLLYLYFGVLLSHILLLAMIPLFFYCINAYYYIINAITKIFIWIDLFILLIIDLAFWGRKNGKTYFNVGRWLKKGKKK